MIPNNDDSDETLSVLTDVNPGVIGISPKVTDKILHDFQNTYEMFKRNETSIYHLRILLNRRLDLLEEELSVNGNFFQIIRHDTSEKVTMYSLLEVGSKINGVCFKVSPLIRLVNFSTGVRMSYGELNETPEGNRLFSVIEEFLKEKF